MDSLDSDKMIVSSVKLYDYFNLWKNENVKRMECNFLFDSFSFVLYLEKRLDSWKVIDIGHGLNQKNICPNCLNFIDETLYKTSCRIPDNLNEIFNQVIKDKKVRLRMLML